MKIFKILFIGPQLSGKGTQAEVVSKKFNLPIFSTGNILRQKVVEGDKLGKQVEELINRGELVSDELVNKIIAEKIERDRGKGYILDGYPRNLVQAEFLNSFDELTHVFEVYITDEEAVRRISGRRSCPQCQAVYHTQYNPSRQEGKCDKCNVDLIIRDDEKPEVIQTRLATYHQETEAVLEHYKEKGIYYKIDGMPSIAEVTRQVLDKLE